MPALSAKNLSKDYNGPRAVDSIDFEIDDWECFGFLGPNGAGKTTVMRMIYCFILPSAGEIRVFGLDVSREPSMIKSRIGVMPQEDNLDPELTVFENLVVYARYFDIPKMIASRLAGELLDFVELREKAAVKVPHLSGGMKRRLVLARSLINEPSLLILDEPTTGLDPHSRRSVWEKLNHLKFKNTTPILTTHYMEEAGRLCDRVAIMDAGKIIAVVRGYNTGKMDGAVAVGRDANFLQWGFSARPAKMTEAGRNFFVNCICYIAKCRPLTKSDASTP